MATIERLFAQADPRAHREGDRVFEDVVARHPRDAGLLEHWIGLHARRGDVARAASAVARAGWLGVELDPSLVARVRGPTSRPA